MLYTLKTKINITIKLDVKNYLKMRSCSRESIQYKSIQVIPSGAFDTFEIVNVPLQNVNKF